MIQTITMQMKNLHVVSNDNMLWLVQLMPVQADVVTDALLFPSFLKD